VEPPLSAPVEPRGVGRAGRFCSHPGARQPRWGFYWRAVIVWFCAAAVRYLCQKGVTMFHNAWRRCRGLFLGGAVVGWVGLTVVTAWAVDCPAGNRCSCVEIQVDTCALSAGLPPDCSLCRGIFQPCWDTYCYLGSSRCNTAANGSTNCTETVIGNTLGMYRSCVSAWNTDWVNCLGQPNCMSAGVFGYSNGSRYSCSAPGS
jgi:hypothetical protein